MWASRDSPEAYLGPPWAVTSFDPDSPCPLGGEETVVQGLQFLVTSRPPSRQPAGWIVPLRVPAHRLCWGAVAGFLLPLLLNAFHSKCNDLEAAEETGHQPLGLLIYGFSASGQNSPQWEARSMLKPLRNPSRPASK